MKPAIITAAFCSMLCARHSFAQESAATHNIISVSPVQLSNATPTGAGLQYEHMLSPKLSLYIPLAYAWGKNDPCDATARAHIGYAYPGIKYYPAGYAHKVTYSVGPSLVIGSGYTTRTITFVQHPWDNYLHTATQRTNETQLGMLINNSLNVALPYHLYFGAEVGIGMLCADIIDGHNTGPGLALQGNMRIG